MNGKRISQKNTVYQLLKNPIQFVSKLSFSIWTLATYNGCWNCSSFQMQNRLITLEEIVVIKGLR